MVTNAAMVKLAKSDVEGCTDDITAWGWSGYKPNCTRSSAYVSSFFLLTCFEFCFGFTTGRASLSNSVT